jgi:hypothetical protein
MLVKSLHRGNSEPADVVSSEFNVQMSRASATPPPPPITALWISRSIIKMKMFITTCNRMPWSSMFPDMLWQNFSSSGPLPGAKVLESTKSKNTESAVSLDSAEREESAVMRALRCWER